MGVVTGQSYPIDLLPLRFISIDQPFEIHVKRLIGNLYLKKMPQKCPTKFPSN